MSILIKGVEMPKTCYECPCGDNEFCECNATEGRISYHHNEYGYPDGERQEWCPLVPVPPHGRLIESVELYGKVEDALANAQQADDAIEELQRKLQTQIELTKFFRDKTFELENRFEDYRMKSRARGKWELFKCRDAWRHYQCSVCGKIVHNDIYDKTDCRSNYCPDCGANMEVSE